MREGDLEGRLGVSAGDGDGEASLGVLGGRGVGKDSREMLGDDKGVPTVTCDGVDGILCSA